MFHVKHFQPGTDLFHVKHNDIPESLSEASLDITQNAQEKVGDYLTLLLRERSLKKITASQDPSVISREHIIPAISFGRRIIGRVGVDIGSGAGFPAVPAAIIRPELDFSLLEPMRSRYLFLRSLSVKLGLKNLKVYQMRAEDAGRDKRFRGKYDFATTRAVLPLTGSSELALPLLKKGGRFFALPGKSAELQLEDASGRIIELGGSPEYSGEGVVIIRKVKDTPERFPRSWKRISSDSDT